MSTTANIQQMLLYCAYYIDYAQRPYQYTPPPGGFINNDVTEYNAITWTDSVYSMPPWALLGALALQAGIFVDEAYAADNIKTDEAAIAALATAVTGKFANPTGTTAQYIRGDGSLATYTPGGTRTQSALTLSMVGTGATGTQIDASHDTLIAVTVSTSATATIAGAATSSVALKICATNNATEASWTTVQTSETSQSYSLAVALQGVTGGKGCLTSLVPAGWYAKLVNTGSGTHAETFVSGQKVIYS